VPNQEKMFNNSSNQSTLVEEGMPLFKKWGKELMIILQLYKDLSKIQSQKQLVISLWRNHKKYYNSSYTTK
jgi:hypothetical protein